MRSASQRAPRCESVLRYAPSRAPASCGAHRRVVAHCMRQCGAPRCDAHLHGRAAHLTDAASPGACPDTPAHHRCGPRTCVSLRRRVCRHAPHGRDDDVRRVIAASGGPLGMGNIENVCSLMFYALGARGNVLHCNALIGRPGGGSCRCHRRKLELCSVARRLLEGILMRPRPAVTTHKGHNLPRSDSVELIVECLL